MFTGIVQELGRVAGVERNGDGLRLRIDAGARETSCARATPWRSAASA